VGAADAGVPGAAGAGVARLPAAGCPDGVTDGAGLDGALDGVRCGEAAADGVADGVAAGVGVVGVAGVTDTAGFGFEVTGAGPGRCEVEPWPMAGAALAVGAAEAAGPGVAGADTGRPGMVAATGLAALGWAALGWAAVGWALGLRAGDATS
jgi:hypothetical protein